MNLKKVAADKAVELIKNQTIVGLGAGSTIAYIVELLAQKIKSGLSVELLTSSIATGDLLQQKNIDISEVSDRSRIDIYFDGCDRFDKNLNALKSGGGIHTHEKLLASMADEFIIVADESKQVEEFDSSVPLVVELIPESVCFVSKRIELLYSPMKIVLRKNEKTGMTIITSNGNYLLDCWLSAWPELSLINPALKKITGVIETSLFYQMATQVIVGREEGVMIMDRK